eukprot:365982-Chlamydomonas_euryale.AAC.2
MGFRGRLLGRLDFVGAQAQGCRTRVAWLLAWADVGGAAPPLRGWLSPPLPSPHTKSHERWAGQAMPSPALPTLANATHLHMVWNLAVSVTSPSVYKPIQTSHPTPHRQYPTPHHRHPAPHRPYPTPHHPYRDPHHPSPPPHHPNPIPTPF